ncbi:hypothetical protein BX600DRAFT_514834 [Xylariales sp. PMI_506]|nr:hypothetical protein BX600DRAFT_514834 [Xylariales sp. PMI_506]
MPNNRKKSKKNTKTTFPNVHMRRKPTNKDKISNQGGQDEESIARESHHREARRRNLTKEIEEMDQFKLLLQVVSGGGEHRLSPQDAVRQVKEWTLDAFLTKGLDVPFGPGFVDYNVSRSVIELAQRLEPSEQSRLIEFMLLLQKESVEDPATGEIIRIQGQALWAELPSFGYTEYEEWWEFGGTMIDPWLPEFIPEQKRRWTNLNAFLAQMSQAVLLEQKRSSTGYTSAEATTTSTAATNSPHHVLDLSLQGLWAIQFALEKGGSEKLRPAALADTPAMSAACTWFAHAADRLWDNVRAGVRYGPHSIASPQKGRRFANRGWCGFERDRWDVWRQGLEEAEAAKTTSEEAKEAICKALKAMERAMVDEPLPA